VEPDLFPLLVIENFDVRSNVLYSLLSRCIPAMVNLFILEHAPQTFHPGVVVVLSFPAHRRRDSEPVEQ
jgi:hypothetical protein